MEDFKKTFITALLGYAAQKDVPPPELCKLSDIDYGSLNSKDGLFITPILEERLWKNASQLSGDDLFGLHFGESMQLAALGVIGQMLQSSNTVGEALDLGGGMVHLITDLFQIRVSHFNATALIEIIVNAQKADKLPFTCRHMSDYLAAFILHELDGLILKKIMPSSVNIPYTGSKKGEYQRVFRCSVKNKPGNISIELPASFLSLPVISANHNLQQHLLQQMGELADGDINCNNLRQKIYHYLITNSYMFTLSLNDVANNFNLSSRTMQRKLKEEGTTFFEIVAEVRKTMAINYLSTGNYQVKEIAYSLGYNESSAFVRAFKNWTGKTPLEYKDSEVT